MKPQFLIIPLILLLSEFYFIQAVRTFSRDFSTQGRNIFLWSCYALLILDIGFIIAGFFLRPSEWNVTLRFVFGVLFILIVCKVFCTIFLLPEDIVRFFRWCYAKLFPVHSVDGTANGITRLKFISQVALTMTVIPAIGFIYGMVRGAYKYRVHRVNVPSPNLPESFHGFKIVQLSDIHTGSFASNEHLNHAFDIVMEQGADLILFTGDLVNNESRETIGYEEVYKKLKAPHGVFSVLGNHDYGDYVQWDSPEEKKANLQNLIRVQQNSGWKMLMNEHVAIEKNGQQIGLLGVENWGGSMHFPKYGKLEKANQGTERFPFKILMSHDPSHWEMVVSKNHSDIDLTLSGHTHGMQMGIEIPGFKWSPVKYLYKYWAGLYKQDNQFLYVNRGLGFLGYPGRIGIWPEITVIELQKV